jgi:hypothetical protein
MEEKQPAKAFKPRGYLYVLIEKFTIPSIDKPISCSLTLGSNASCETKACAPGAPCNEVFLIEVPNEVDARLVAEFKEGLNSVG